ncbi:MAG: glutamine--fructose-6-phosphate aminotransferase, partial [Desulfovibrio sp.]|nr:glutamine--fructose-6-phosphate aminotransferase [Desulfovibrio sp.]
MCGIIGYTGHRPAIPVVLDGLSHLEYRGYDSSGLGFCSKQELKILKAAGKLNNLRDKLAHEDSALVTTCAIGHTRWATHGAPEERNAHPHVSNDQSLAIVHNGIIENYLELKSELEAKGYHFQSDTDTEVLVNLIQEMRKTEADFLSAFAKALQRAHGAYAVCVLEISSPNVLYAARHSAPLIFGHGVGENFIASDVPAFLSYTREVVFLEDGELLRVDSNHYELRRIVDCTVVERPCQTITWSMQAAQKGGYRHFMLKEIFEQPKVITDCLAGRIAHDRVLLSELDTYPVPKRLHIIACGTSY